MCMKKLKKIFSLLSFTEKHLWPCLALLGCGVYFCFWVCLVSSTDLFCYSVLTGLMWVHQGLLLCHAPLCLTASKVQWTDRLQGECRGSRLISTAATDLLCNLVNHPVPLYVGTCHCSRTVSVWGKETPVVCLCDASQNRRVWQGHLAVSRRSVCVFNQGLVLVTGLWRQPLSGASGVCLLFFCLPVLLSSSGSWSKPPERMAVINTQQGNSLASKCCSVLTGHKFWKW